MRISDPLKEAYLQLSYKLFFIWNEFEKLMSSFLAVFLFPLKNIVNECRAVKLLVCYQHILERVVHDVENRFVVLKTVKDDISNFLSKDKQFRDISILLKTPGDIMNYVLESQLQHLVLFFPQTTCELPNQFYLVLFVLLN